MPLGSFGPRSTARTNALLRDCERWRSMKRNSARCIPPSGPGIAQSSVEESTSAISWRSSRITASLRTEPRAAPSAIATRASLIPTKNVPKSRPNAERSPPVAAKKRRASRSRGA